jgi:hypothetical protein
MEGVMKKTANTVALVTAAALSLGVLGPAATVSAADRPSADGTKPNYNYWPRSGETGSNDYHADYHADYSANRGGDRTGGRDETQGRETRRDSRALPDVDRHAPSPYGWRR